MSIHLLQPLQISFPSSAWERTAAKLRFASPQDAKSVRGTGSRASGQRVPKRSLGTRAGGFVVGLALAALLILQDSLFARTITLTAEDCDEMAVLSAKAPRASWASWLSATGVLNAEGSVQMYSDMAILMRFPLGKAIPKDQRITKAELSLEANYLAGTLTEIHVRRLLADWGTGVCHQYYRTFPKKIEWAQPGGRGGGTDRANKDTAIFKIPKVGEYTVDVTEDIDLWYTGGVANRGWILTMEQNTGPVYLAAPHGPHHGTPKKWKLQITFEPK